jgi:hypothetical protein
LDHFCCDRRNCVNPLHTVPTTRGQNALRDSGGGAGSNRAKTRCPHGHEYTPENTMTGPQGWRRCRACHNKTERGRTSRTRAPYKPVEGPHKRPGRKPTTHCKNGHEWTEDNTRMTPKGRSCRTCFNAWQRDRYWQEKVAR